MAGHGRPRRRLHWRIHRPPNARPTSGHTYRTRFVRFLPYPWGAAAVSGTARRLKAEDTPCPASSRRRGNRAMPARPLLLRWQWHCTLRLTIHSCSSKARTHATHAQHRINGSNRRQAGNGRLPCGIANTHVHAVKSPTPKQNPPGWSARKPQCVLPGSRLCARACSPSQTCKGGATLLLHVLSAVGQALRRRRSVYAAYCTHACCCCCCARGSCAVPAGSEPYGRWRRGLMTGSPCFVASPGATTCTLAAASCRRAPRCWLGSWQRRPPA